MQLNPRDQANSVPHAGESAPALFDDDLRIIEQLGTDFLGGPLQYDVDQLAERAGLSREKVEDYWLWLGTPVKRTGEPQFTDSDVQALIDLKKLIVTESLDDPTIASLVRSVGHSAERLVNWQIEALIENLAKEQHQSDAVARRAVIGRFPQIFMQLKRQSEHAYRRAAAGAIHRYAAEVQHRKLEPSSDPLPAPQAVGFADIVGFTKRTAAMAPDELATYVRDYESKARDLVTSSGGRVVKTVGDAVLFVADDLECGVDVALSLAGPHTTARIETPTRVGMVWGHVLQRFGDVFGSRVNLAARLTDIAAPSTLFVDPSTAALLASREKYQLSVMPEAQIQGLGVMRPVKVSVAANT